MAIQRMAIVDADNNVVNVILYDTDGGWEPPEGTRIIEDGSLDSGAACPGGTWDGSKFVPPIEPPIKLWWQK